ncbi:MAG: DUF3365 domain-containing protein [Mariniblastus sp.]|nr:DUF3365 domain-containing protein [Mariniblastus sp.]
MKKLWSLRACLPVALMATFLSVLVGCGGGTGGNSEANGKPGIPHKQFADAVHAVMMADRTVYAQHVVDRLKAQESVVKPDEYWHDEDGTIPLPAQMFRMGAELVSENEEAGFSYSLKSKWPLNEQNKANSDLEVAGLDYVTANPEENFYGEEELAGVNYYTAVYADVAVAGACSNCHNSHANRGDDYPEFKTGDVMGGVIIRIPMR